MLFSSFLKKPPWYRKCSEPETNPLKKIIKSVLNTVAFHLEDHNHKEVKFSGETLNCFYSYSQSELLNVLSNF